MPKKHDHHIWKQHSGKQLCKHITVQFENAFLATLKFVNDVGLVNEQQRSHAMLKQGPADTCQKKTQLRNEIQDSNTKCPTRMCLPASNNTGKSNEPTCLIDMLCRCYDWHFLGLSTKTIKWHARYHDANP